MAKKKITSGQVAAELIEQENFKNKIHRPVYSVGDLKFILPPDRETQLHESNKQLTAALKELLERLEKTGLIINFPSAVKRAREAIETAEKL